MTNLVNLSNLSEFRFNSTTYAFPIRCYRFVFLSSYINCRMSLTSQ